MISLRRTHAAVLLSGLTCVAAVGAAQASVPPAPGDGPVRQAVILFDGAAVDLAGVEVVHRLPALSGAVVRGRGEALARAGRASGVRGIAPDDAIVLTGSSDRGKGARAASGLGHGAGRPGAGAGVRVALVDTGVSDTAGLSRAGGRLLDVFDSSSAASGSGRPDVLDDGFGHGTFMASVVAGGPTATSAQPVGVAPGATVLVVRVAEPDGSTSLSQVVRGLDWIAAHPESVDVVNLSFSHTRPGESYGADPLTDAVERIRAAGTTVVVSAGNDPSTVGDPGFDPRVVSVGAADLRNREVAAFSGSGVAAGVARPDVVAHGVDVLGVVPAASVIGRGTAPDEDGLVRGTGSSQATAVVSGAAALLLAEYPHATPAQVKASLRTVAKDLPGRRDGAGLLRVPTRLHSGPDGTAPGSGQDLTGESAFDASSWSASSWSASSWSASSWSASSWSASSWSAGSWANGSGATEGRAGDGSSSGSWGTRR